LRHRLCEAIAVRTDGGIKYGVDNCKPYRLTVEEPEKLITILDEFFDSDGRGLVFDGLKRAPLLNDICAVFAASPIGVGARPGHCFSAPIISLARQR
jgi:hypothetical protein